MAKTSQILFTCTEEFKNAIGIYAQKHDMSVSELIRQSTANVIGYSLEEEANEDKRRKYKNAEERKEAQRKKQKEDRASVKLLLEAYAKEQAVFDAAFIRQGLIAKGVNPDE